MLFANLQIVLNQPAKGGWNRPRQVHISDIGELVLVLPSKDITSGSSNLEIFLNSTIELLYDVKVSTSFGSGLDCNSTPITINKAVDGCYSRKIPQST
jgi:hypothetical protein